jgi:hypothetical protein
MTTYNFNKQFELGKTGEEQLDNLFKARGLDVEICDSMSIQRQGIDRRISNPLTQEVWSVEYKTDFQGAKTGNIFLEMCWKDRAGWVLTTQSDYVVYYLPEKCIFIFRPEVIREHISSWLNSLKWRTVKNESYEAYGMLLPIERLKSLCKSVIDVY